MTIIKWDELQLRFELPEFDEAAEDAVERAISPEEARLISETARERFVETLESWDVGTLNEEKHGWFGDYLLLIGQGWPWRVATYIAWASSPKVGREPGTLEELATMILGLKSPRVIYKWRSKYASIDTVVAMMQAKPLWEHRADVFEALWKMATDENYKAHNDRKLFLEMLGDYVPRSVVGVGKLDKGGSLSEKSEEELRKWAGELTTDSDHGLNGLDDSQNEGEIASQETLAMTIEDDDSYDWDTDWDDEKGEEIIVSAE